MEHNTQRENVGAVVQQAARCLFRRHVSGRAHHYADLRLAIRSQREIATLGCANVFCQPEVQDLDVAFVRNHDIARLQVAMHNSLVMCNRKRIA